MATPSPCLEPERLQAFAFGRLPEADAQSIAHHVEACESCLSNLQRLTQRDLATKRIGGPANRHSIPEVSVLPDTYAFLRPPVEPDEIGRMGEHRVLRLLGRGGMGLVFHAEDLALRRPVALKVVKPDLDEQYQGWQRFLREARILAAIKHEHVVTIYQAGQEGGVVYLAMELLEGESLDERMERVGQFPIAEVLRLGREIASGLAAIHRHGLVHRDIKPGNIWLESSTELAAQCADRPDDSALRIPSSEFGKVKLLDFGLARLIDDDCHITQTGVVVGTPAYMSPEQARGTSVDERSDLFSLGCILYTLCTGREPFTGPDTMARLTALAVDPPRPIVELNAHVPPRLAELVMELLAKRPQDRPDSADEVVVRLQEIERSPSTLRRKALAPGRRGRRTALLLGGLVALAVLAGLAGSSMLREDKAYEAEPGWVYLSQLPMHEAVEWPATTIPGGRQRLYPFSRIHVGGVRSPNGIAMHGSSLGSVRVSYRLRKEYDRFAATVSLNDTSHHSTLAMTFAVHGDGQLLWQSPPMSDHPDSAQCLVPIKGVDILSLILTTPAGREPKGAHGAWVEPRVSKD